MSWQAFVKYKDRINLIANISYCQAAVLIVHCIGQMQQHQAHLRGGNASCQGGDQAIATAQA